MKRKLSVLIIFLTLFLNAKEIHVSVKGDDKNNGTSSKPLRTINYAAQLAVAGDVVIVHAGIYREKINPARGGDSDANRIVYKAADGEKVEIKGSEILNEWTNVKAGVWKKVIPNTFFGNYNPFTDYVQGDWCNNFGKSHTCDIFINGKTLYEKDKMELVNNPVVAADIKDKDGSVYTWYSETDATNTTVWANFQKKNPNKELVEVSIRNTCFYPEKTGVNYITVSGFEFSQAATQWGAPTAEQIGMVSTHWNKGWIIENNIIHDSKCSGITLGKERSSGHNVWTTDKDNIFNDGNIHYIEVIFKVLRLGWSKENIGSHIVRNNTIYNCEQTGICGSMGAVFSLIENNHIYNICQKKQFGGAELGGIKLHAPIDTQIIHNRIHDVAAFGFWLDWMTQGTRVSRNLLYNNGWSDIFVEVSHGPFLIDNNILLSDTSFSTQSAGGAYVHNFILGKFALSIDKFRFTPYHLTHSTDISGLSNIVPGDDRFYNNIFLTKNKPKGSSYENDILYGLDKYKEATLPVFYGGNVYYCGAVANQKEKDFGGNNTFNTNFKMEEEGDKVFISYDLDDDFSKAKTQIINSEILGKTIVSKGKFENPDATPIIFDVDYFGNKRQNKNPVTGPFEKQEKKVVRMQVW